jgi:hypothetical protein
VSSKKIDPVGAQPTDPPGWRLLFMLVQGHEGQWWRGFLLVSLTGLLSVALLVTLLALAGWTGGILSVGSLAALGLARHRRPRHHSLAPIGGPAGQTDQTRQHPR